MSFLRILNTINMLKDGDSNPPLADIAIQNNHVRTIKEMDGAQDEQAIKDAIKSLSEWVNSRQAVNRQLSEVELKSKKEKLTEALEQYNNGYYFMMKCVVMNVIGCGALAYWTVMSKASIAKKLMGLLVAGVGAAEGSIHSYKGKRFFAQGAELIKIELNSVNEVLESKSTKSLGR